MRIFDDKRCDDTIRLAIDRELGSIQLDASQKSAILAQCRPSLTVAPRHRPMRRVLAVAASFAAVMVLSVGTLAAAPELRESLKGLSEDTIAILQPVNQVSEDQGIRMEVLGAVNDGGVAVAFLSLQDTTGQGRVSDTVRLMDCQISDDLGIAIANVVSYDETTETAILRLEGMGGDADAGEKITVSARSLLSGEQQVSDESTGYTVSELIASGPAAEYAPPEEGLIMGSMASVDDPENAEITLEEIDQLKDSGKVPVLEPWAEGLKIDGVDWATVAAAAKIGNQLHIQYNTDSVLGGVNSLSFRLKDSSGQILDLPMLELNIGPRTELSRELYYTETNEYVLFLPEGQDVSDMEVVYSGTTYDSLTQGNWSTTFRLEQVKERLQSRQELDLGGWTVESVTVSPVAVTVRGSGDLWDLGGEMPEVRVWLQDGTQVDASSAGTSIDGEDVTLNSMFNEILDLSQVKTVTLNGEPLEMEYVAE
ncbi:DUF4179 domain-containing protein [Allofournierella massiliensis]|uniref:DUF4179 domain-containing protein n=1 Tax=Allofournierella massiliensis TaxID=1650663 RepID=A0A4R1R429_9FIRM|nr:DUF4179 domain-containing protein [Fournierella massiliensis]TCL60236.1 hypothetical protein EDD77_104117 [Fournierella massiliensis]